MSTPSLTRDRPPSLQGISLGVACPLANEIDTAERFVRDVLDHCIPFQFGRVRFFAVLDNVSRDGTLERLRERAAEWPELQVVFAPENRCVVDAYVRGYREALAAECDWILEMDAGYSHQPADIPRFFEAMHQGYDCVFGSRFCAGGRITEGSAKRWLISRGGTIISNALLGTRLHDMTSGFELFTREALTYILDRGIRSRGPFFQTEIKAFAHRFRITEVPIHYRAPSHAVGAGSIGESFANLGRLFALRVSRSLYA